MVIDWTKPLRTIKSGYPATSHVLPTGERVARWIDNVGGTHVALLDDEGRLRQPMRWLAKGAPYIAERGHRVVENVPEDRNWVVVVRRSEDGTPAIYDYFGAKWLTKAEADDIVERRSREFPAARYVAVRVSE